MTVHFEHLTNLSLLRNNLYHISFELGKYRPSFARIAKESYLTLVRAMVEALKGSTNIAITGRPKSSKREAYYKIGNQPHYKIEKESVPGCKRAWRYSEPVTCPEIEIENEKIDFDSYYKTDNFLIGFYDLLAMIQTDCFMLRYVHSKKVEVSNDEMVYLEKSHENLRNEYEHFIPKSYSIDKYGLMIISKLCLEIVEKLLYTSGNVYELPRGIKTHLYKAIKKLVKLKAEYEKKYIKKL